MSFPKYAEYKESGVEWIEDIPAHWKIGAIKSQCVEITDGAHVSPETEGGTYPFISTKDILSGEIDFEECLKTSQQSYDYLFRTGCRPNIGDVLFSKDGTIGRTVVVKDNREFVVASSLIILRPSHECLDSEFLGFWCQSRSVQSQVERFVRGAGLPRLSIANLRRIVGCFPPLEEQRAIAAFLGRETSKIDALVAEQRRLIALLKEKRQAVISHAVTKGLDPTVKLKDSGIEWLGQVPEHWEVKRLRHAADIDNNLRTPIDLQSRMDMAGDYPYYGPTGILSYIDRFNVEGQYCLVGEDGDHFLKWRDQPMTLYVEGQFSVNNHAHLLRGKDGCSTRWVCAYFEHRELLPWLIKQGVGRYKLRKSTLVEIPVAVPPPDEQQVIVAEIDRTKTGSDLLIERANQAIGLLSHRRQSLIAAAVTGKIDVGFESAEQ